jgi:hypothetical protein
VTDAPCPMTDDAAPCPCGPAYRCPDPAADPEPAVRREGDRYVLTVAENLRYDRERGTLDTLVDGVVREQMLVRQGLVEELTRSVLVEELRRLGYVVIEPGATS